MDEVFKALADPSRRKLLDQLFQRDGQTLSELCEHLPMSRFGTMKHLKILEQAGLIATRMEGREKLHFLNPVPVRLIHDRWTSKYAAPFTRALAGLKQQLENPMPDPSLKHVYEIYIHTTPERLWQAITDPTFTRQYFYESQVKSDFKVGSPVAWVDPEGAPMIEGKILESMPPTKLVTTFQNRFGGGGRDDRPSRVTWAIEQQGPVCKLTLTHDDFDGETETYKVVRSGWNPVLSGLKTLLETGKALPIPRAN
jgi:DNA-binding transcriptional ArsR family regulator/uncharacterized protein YndB with AHSA1/START domain